MANNIVKSTCKTSVRNESYYWTIKTEPCLMTNETAYPNVTVRAEKFTTGYLSKLEHSCYAEIDRKNASFVVYLSLPPSQNVKWTSVALTFVSKNGSNLGRLPHQEILNSGTEKSDSVDKYYAKFECNRYWRAEIDSIQFDFSVRVEEAPIVTPRMVDLPQEIHPLRQSSGLLENFFNSQSFSDFDIVCENETLHAHKIVLAHCSPVFQKMFEGTNKEMVENQVTINESVNTITQLLKWMYTGKTAEDMELQDQIDLYKISHRYEVQGLRNRCLKVIFSAINADNALEIYLLGKVYEDVLLAKEASEAVLKNKNHIFADPNATAKYFQQYPQFMQPFLLSK